MVSKKKDMFFVDARELVCGIDFVVDTCTTFDANVVNHFYSFENHEIDYKLAQILGLGVARNLLMEDDFYIYNASDDRLDNFGMMYEIARLGIYYQITHPDYDDKDLEEMMIGNSFGKEFLKQIQTVETDMPYMKLKEIFNSKKGNVVLFEK